MKTNPILLSVLAGILAAVVTFFLCLLLLPAPAREETKRAAPSPLLGAEWGAPAPPSAYELNLNDLGTQLLFSTVPIVSRKATGTEQGTGFIFQYEKDGNTYPLLVTNRHIVEDAMEGAFYMVSARDGKPDTKNPVAIHFGGSLFVYDPCGPDLAAALIGPLVNQTQAQGKPLFFRGLSAKLIPDRKTFSGVGAIEEIVFLGYPRGLMDPKNRTPLIRRGITATPPWNNFEGRPVFLVDANVFEGSSGSPVFIYNRSFAAAGALAAPQERLLFLGVVTGTIKETDPRQGTQTYLGLGIVINSLAVYDCIEEAVKKALAKEAGKAGR